MQESVLHAFSGGLWHELQSLWNSPHSIKAYMWHPVGKGPIWSFVETKILGKIGKTFKKSKKCDFSYFGVLRHQKHPYVGRILKKLLQGSIRAQFYMAINGPFDRFLLQASKVSVKRRKNKFPLSEDMAY